MSILNTSLLASPWLLVAAVGGLLGLLLAVAGLWALVRLRPLSFLMRSLGAALLFAFAAGCATIAIGTAGYTALTRETTAAVVRVQPTGPQRFSAVLQLPDGRMATYPLSGDEFYIDAHILKWKPAANLVGLHTAYELDRIAGRYRALADEQKQPRTVHAIGMERPIDLFDLRQRHSFLAPLLDVEYGSATFVPVNRPAEFEVRVSTSGLLIRERQP